MNVLIVIVLKPIFLLNDKSVVYAERNIYYVRCESYYSEKNQGNKTIFSEMILTMLSTKANPPAIIITSDNNCKIKQG